MIFFFIGLGIGCFVGAICSLLVASNRVKEIEASWYEICSRITDGYSKEEAMKGVKNGGINKTGT